MKGRITRKTGGVVEKNPAPSDVYAGANSNVVKEAKERKRGGKTMAKDCGDKAKGRMDRAPRKSGGRTMGLMSAAAKGVAPKGRKLDMN